jgi:hypothetical protein
VGLTGDEVLVITSSSKWYRLRVHQVAGALLIIVSETMLAHAGRILGCFSDFKPKIVSKRERRSSLRSDPGAVDMQDLYQQEQMSKRNSRLWDFEFRRVIVDESQQMFRGKHDNQQANRDTKNDDFALVEAERVLQIPKRFGWVVTGTTFPDEYALRTTLRFLCTVSGPDAAKGTSLAALDFNHNNDLTETKYSFFRSTIGVAAVSLLDEACMRSIDSSLLPSIGVTHRLSTFSMTAAEPSSADFDFDRLKCCDQVRNPFAHPDDSNNRVTEFTP